MLVLDFFSKELMTMTRIHQMMMCVFGLKHHEVVVCDGENVAQIQVSDEVSCFCVVHQVGGDVALLIQIYRADMALSLFLTKLNVFADKHQQVFFVPYDEFCRYYRIAANQPIGVIQMDESGACQNFYRIL